MRNATLTQRLKQQFDDAFRKGYPYAQVAFQVWILSSNIRYLFNKTPHWRPWFALMRIEMRRMQGNEQVGHTASHDADRSRSTPVARHGRCRQSQSPRFSSLRCLRDAGCRSYLMRSSMPCLPLSSSSNSWSGGTVRATRGGLVARLRTQTRPPQSSRRACSIHTLTAWLSSTKTRGRIRRFSPRQAMQHGATFCRKMTRRRACCCTTHARSVALHQSKMRVCCPLATLSATRVPIHTSTSGGGAR